MNSEENYKEIKRNELKISLTNKIKIRIMSMCPFLVNWGHIISKAIISLIITFLFKKIISSWIYSLVFGVIFSSFVLIVFNAFVNKTLDKILFININAKDFINIINKNKKNNFFYFDSINESYQIKKLLIVYKQKSYLVTIQGAFSFSNTTIPFILEMSRDVFSNISELIYNNNNVEEIFFKQTKIFTFFSYNFIPVIPVIIFSVIVLWKSLMSGKKISEVIPETFEMFYSPKQELFTITQSNEIKESFDDLAGYKDIKEKLLNLTKAIKNENISVPNGIVLYGPPGTGKTALAAAMCKELGYPFYQTSGNELSVGFIQESVTSRGVNRIRELLSSVKKQIEKSGKKRGILFIDEIDKMKKTPNFGAVIAQGNGGEEFLELLNGIEGRKYDNIFIIMATNYFNWFSPALLRSGRISLQYEIKNPQTNDYRKIILIKLNKLLKRKDWTIEKTEKEIICKEIAEKIAEEDMDGVINGADLEEIFGMFDFFVSISKEELNSELKKRTKIKDIIINSLKETIENKKRRGETKNFGF